MSTLLLLASLLLNTASAQSLSLSDVQKQNLGVSMSPVESVSQTLSSGYPAQVAVPNKARKIVHTSQEGVVVSMQVAEGDAVTKGQLLAVINSPQLVALQSQYLQAYTTLIQSQADMQRDKQLFDEGIIAERRYLESRTRYIQDKTKLDSFEKTLQLSGMTTESIDQLARQRKLNSTLNVYADSDGVVMQQQAIPGQRVDATETLYQLADLSHLWLEIHVPLSVARSKRSGDKATVCDRDVEATITAIGRQVHDIDQGVLVRADVSEHTALLTPGEFVQVCFVGNSEATLYRIPQTAVLRFDGVPSVFFDDGNGITLRAINITSENRDDVMADDAFLAEGKIAISGIASLKSAWLALENN